MEALRDAITGQTTILASRSERQSKEMMRRVKLLALVAFKGDDSYIVHDTNEEIELQGGGRVLSFPSNPDTIAGFTGNVVLDEFARHKQSRDIWEALFASISSKPYFRISVLSTPLGRSGKYYELVQEAKRGGDVPWSLHQCDIHEAVANGCLHDITQLRAACADDQTFRQSYLCEFVDEAYALLPYDDILACVSHGISYEYERDALAQFPDLYLGIDIGRTRDMTVIAVLQRIGDLRVCRGFREIVGQSFAAQEREISELLTQRNVRRACIDATGMGMQLAEQLAARFGSDRVEGIQITAPVKESICGLTRRYFSNRKVQIPDDEALHADLHSVEKTVTVAGNVRYQAPREHGSHADRFTALALGLHAAEGSDGPIHAESVPVTRWNNRAGMW